MAKLIVKAGSTSRLEHVFILDSTSTTGAGKTGLTNASVTMYYWRPGATSVSGQTGTMSAGTLGTWSSFGFKEIDATNLPGLYEVGMPDAMFAVGVNHVVAMIKGTGIAPVVLEYDLVAYDSQDTVRLGLTALPNAACSSNASLITSGTGTAQLSVATGTVTVGTMNNNVITAASITDGAIADDVWNALLSSYATANTFGARLIRVRSTSPTNEAFITAANHIAADVHEIQPATISAADFADGALVIAGASGTGVKAYLAPDSITAGVIANNAIDAASITADADEAIADAVLNRNVAGGSNTGRTVKEALYALRNKSEIVGSTLNVYNNVDGAIAWSATVASSAGANPVTGIDPV